MQSSRLPSFAIDRPGPRPRLVSGWVLIGFALVALAVLAALFPRTSTLQQNLVDEAIGDRGDEQAAMAYMENLLRRDPANDTLRIWLAEKETEAGNYRKADSLLAPLVGKITGPDQLRVRRLRLTIARLATYAEAPDSTARAAHEQAWRALLEAAMRQSGWTPADLGDLGQQALALHDTALAARFYGRIATDPQALPPQQYVPFARLALAAGDYRTAAALYFRAQTAAATLDLQREYFLAAVETLQSGNLLQDALAAADRHIGPLAADAQTLRFLIHLAQSANQPERAAQYAKRLLHMSSAAAWQSVAMRIADLLIPAAHAAETATPPSSDATLKPYNEADYRQAYDAFLAGGDIASALRVAQAAVAQRPHDLAWRKRLAQVAEWSSKPQLALEQWLAIARARGSDDAWQAVLRLAPGVLDDAAQLDAWTHIARQRELTPDQWRAIAHLYEALGRPDDGIAFFERRYRTGRDPLMLEIAAQLMVRAGHDERAIAACRELLHTRAASGAVAVELATLLVQHGDFTGAYTTLDRHKALAQPNDKRYWEQLGDLAWRLQRDAAAREAYGAALRSDPGNRDAVERFVKLTRAEHPDQAAQIAAAGWRKSGVATLLVDALDIYWQQRDLPAMRRLFAQAQPQLQSGKLDLPYFYVLRAGFHEASGERQQALADYRHALAVDPGATQARLGLLWLLIDSRDAAALKPLLSQYAAEASNDRTFWDAYAAAWLVLGDAHRAAALYARDADRHRNDYLWLMSYADALEQSGREGAAWQARRHAWALVHRPARGQPLPHAPRARMEAAARLAIRFAPGDEQLAIVRRVLSSDAAPSAQHVAAGSNGSAANDATVKELVLSWALSTGQSEAARAWAWRNYGRRLAAPAWAAATMALADNDLDQAQRLLERRGRELDAAQAADLAQATGRTALAQSLVFSAMQRHPDDDAIHEQGETLLLQDVDGFALGDTFFDRDVLSGQERRASADLWLTPSLRLTPQVTDIRQKSTDAAQLVNVPGADRQVGLDLRLRRATGYWEAGVFHRDALASFQGWRATAATRWREGFTTTIGAGYNVRALESTPLAVGGMKRQLSAAAQYEFSRREYVNAEVAAARYYTQDGDSLGSGCGIEWELGYRVRTAYPDLTLKLAGEHWRFSKGGTVDGRAATLVPAGTAADAAFFMPDDYNLYGAYAAWGETYRDRYGHAIRPFGQVGLTHNTLSGTGYNLVLGAGGSLLGRDHLALVFSQVRGGNGVNERVREIGVQYRYFF